MIHRSLIAALFAIMTMSPANAEEINLSELRANLSVLRSQLHEFRSELRAAGPKGFQEAGGATAIDRMNAMEEQLTRLTNQAEQLQNRIGSIAADNTSRLKDLEFRLCELDENCDLGALATSNMEIPAAENPALADLPDDPGQQNKSVAASAAEQADFAAANEVLDSGDFRRAAEMFGEVATNHAGGPLTAEALYLRGAALANAGDENAAAGAWLEGFTADPDGPRAAESLLGISDVIAGQGNPSAACLYLAEIPARFAGTSAAIEAEKRIAEINCDLVETTHEQSSDAITTEAGSTNAEAVSDMADHE